MRTTRPAVTDCILLATDRMALNHPRGLAAALAGLAVAAPALAQTAPDEGWMPPPYVRPERAIRALVEDAGVARRFAHSMGRRTFETGAADDAGKRARRELLRTQTGSGNGS